MNQIRFLNLVTLVTLTACSITNTGTILNPFDSSEQSTQIKRFSLDQNKKNQSLSYYNYILGNLKLGQEDFNSALENYNQAASLASEPTPFIHARLAGLYLRQGQLELALEQSSKALQQSSGQELKSKNDNSIQLLHAGILESLGRDQEAEKFYKDLISANHDQATIYVLLANLYLRTERANQGVELLETFLKKNSKSGLVEYYLGKLYETKGELIKAEKFYRQALDSKQVSNQPVLDLVRVLIKQEKLKPAQELCQIALKDQPENTVIRNILGQLLIGTNNLEAALEQLKIIQDQESAQNEDASQTRFKIAIIYLQQQNFEQAIQELSLVLANNPNFSKARYYLAKIYFTQPKVGNLQSNIKNALEQVDKIKPDQEHYADAQLMASLFFRDRGQDPKMMRLALEYAEKAWSTQPDNIELFMHLIGLLRENSDNSRAKKLLEEKIDKLDTNSDQGISEKLFLAYAVALYDLEYAKEADQAMLKVLEINPENSQALNFLAYSYATKEPSTDKNLDLALDYIQKALKYKSADPYYLDTLAYIYLQKNKPGDALVLLQRAVSATVDDIVILEHYAQSLFLTGDQQQAIEIYRKIKKLAKQLKQAGKKLDREEKQSIERLDELLGEFNKDDQGED